MYSIVETARENGLHPYHYIEHLLTELPSCTTSDLVRLLLWSEELPEICYAPIKAGG